LIRVSIGTAGVLGLAQVQMAVVPTTAYLMLGERCAMNCAFCAQARQSQASEMVLSRVSWPAFPLDRVCVRLEEAERRGTVRRCCIQVTVGQDVYRDTLAAMRSIRQATRLPLDVAILPADMEQVAELIAAGADHVGFGLDAACACVQTASQYPGRAAVHLIVGLGETEQEMVERMSWVHDRGAVVGLFAFTPVRGTALADRPPPSLAQYRRMQAARWLIVRGGACMPDFAFDERGALRGIAIPGWPALLAGGEAFRTSGCPDCNRPFYNERPGGTMYNYPRPLTAGEAQQAIQEMEIKG